MKRITDSGDTQHLGIAGGIAKTFLNSRLSPLLIITSVLLGILAVLMLPREEEPQIKVPMVDVMVSMPGFSAKEVEERATRPMEKLLWEISGVEYVYSTSKPGASLVIVRFKVGEDLEDSIVRLNQKLASNFDRIPPGVSFPLIKPRSIDDVPILALTLHSERYDHYTLRRLAAQIEEEVKRVPNVAETKLIGGLRRELRVLFDPIRLAARGLSPAGLISTLHQANRQFSAGALTGSNQELLLESGGFLNNIADAENVVVGASGGKPVYLRDVAKIEDASEEPSQYVFFGDRSSAKRTFSEDPAVTLTVAKRPGTNAVAVADEVLHRIELLKGNIIPRDVSVAVTRNYGETAADKANELLFHMGIAVLSVTLLIFLALGARESVIVLLAIPSTLALTLLTFYLTGFTLNRITLFALIFSIGILVDDAIVVVENIARHFKLPESRGRPASEIALAAVAEVGNPTILATFAVIAAVLPMAFVGGLMGPYMRPIPIGASAAMFFSLVIAFIVTPWGALRVLRGRDTHAVEGAKLAEEQSSADDGGHEEDRFTRFYRRWMGMLLSSRRHGFYFIGGTVLLLLLAASLVGLGLVKVKMLPFDNKSEFQVILNLPEGSSLETTAQAAKEIARQVSAEPEIANYQIYAGVAAPYNFNGLVRHYFLRQGASVADIQFNLVPDRERSLQSHDVVKKIRPLVAAIAARFSARVSVTEVPPGPPVLQTVVAEVYGESDEQRLKFAAKVRELMIKTPGVVDVDWYVEAPQQKVRLVIDKEKAALHGISAETISQTLKVAVEGERVGILHIPQEKEDVAIVLQLPLAKRSEVQDLLNIGVRSGDGNQLPEPITHGAPQALVTLRELVKVEHVTTDTSIYHKNLLPVTYVVSDVAGEIESPVYAISELNRKLAAVDMREFGNSQPALEIFNISQPSSVRELSMKWDGEWQITLEVFRDLGAAFVVVLVLIYLLMVGWFSSFVTPLIVMAAIPFSLIGILPAHGLMGAFFGAPSMIGFMAGAGIVVRNSIILVDFIELRLKEGWPLAEAVIDAGAVRFRPMLLTAMAVVVGSGVILFDPIFQGLAISLMAGEVASLLLSRMAVPVLYYLAHKNNAVTKLSPT